MTTRYGVFQGAFLLASFNAEPVNQISLVSTARRSLEGRYGPLRARTMPFTDVVPIAGEEPPLPPPLH